jgi:hypothetical protein
MMVEMLADTLTMLGAAFIGLVGGTLVLMIVLHAFAWWTLRDIDRDREPYKRHDAMTWERELDLTYSRA